MSIARIFIGVTGMVLFGLLIFYIAMLIRNEKVYKERGRVLEIMSKLCDRDIANGRPWIWRYYEFNKISYDKMAYEWLVPVKSYYANARFLRP